MVDGFFKKVKDAIVGNDDELNLDNANRDRTEQGQYGDVRPASEDPYGDPGSDQAAGSGEYGDVRPASEDPYGDPADQVADYGDVRPASEDPFGDPADQYNA